MNQRLMVQSVREYFFNVDNAGESLFALAELLGNSDGKKLYHLERLASLVAVIGSDLLYTADMGKKALETLDAFHEAAQAPAEAAKPKVPARNQKPSPREVPTTT